MKKIKVAVSQRIIPEYRIGVFNELCSREDLDVTVLYGRGLKIGTEVNASKIDDFKNVLLPTIIIPYFQRKTQRLRVIHPTLFFYLIKNRIDVILTEPISNIFNLISIFFYCKIFHKAYVWHEPGGAKKETRRLSRKIIDPFIRYLINNASAFATYNSYSDYFLQEYYEIPKAKIFRAQNALDTISIENDIERFSKIIEQNPYYSFKHISKIVLFIGAIEKRKRINNLIKSVRLLNDIHNISTICLIIGDGPDEDWLKKQCSEKELKYTHFLGKHIDDIVSYILLSDLVVLPGQGGLSLNHALACGKPIIATEEGLVPFSTSVYDYIDHGKNGFIAKVNDVEDLTQTIQQCFTNDEIYSDLCANAKIKSENFSVKSMVNGFVKAIKYAYESTSNK